MATKFRELTPAVTHDDSAALEGLKPLDYYGVMSDGLRPALLSTNYKLEILGDNSVVVRTQISPRVSSMMHWSLDKDGWRAKWLQVTSQR